MSAVFYRLPPELTPTAELQCGVLSAAQLAAAGLARESQSLLVRAGHWQRLYRGVYAVHSGQPVREAQLWAAVLAAGPGAMLSHQTAAETARLTDKPSELIHLKVPATRRIAQPAGTVLHYSQRAAEALHPVLLPPQTRIEETVLDLVGAAAAWTTRSPG
jgi:predicted transcriptional regulator of viral defense system